MDLAPLFAIVDDALGPEGRAMLRPPAKRSDIAAVERKRTAPLPAALRTLYEQWHDGETSTSTLFDDVLHDDFSEMWTSYFDDAPFEVRFLTLGELSPHDLDVWIAPDGEASREERAGWERTVAVPFVWIRSIKETEEEWERPAVDDDDWLLAVDASHGAVWLYEVGDEELEGIAPQEGSLAAWLEAFAAKAMQMRRDLGLSPVSLRAPLQDPAALLVRFMLERNLVELADGATVDDVAQKLAPLLALTPPKRAVRAVLDQLSDDDAIAEVFADDELLAKVVAEFVG